MTTTSTLSGELAGFVARTGFEDLPPDVVHETKRVLLDVLGCALGSGGLEKGRIAVEFATASGGRPEATVLGTPHRVPAALAAFANAELIHATDHCPILPPAHVSPFVTSPALALAEAERAPGTTLVLAVALAHEIASRVGLALDSMRVPTGGIAPSWGLSFDSFGAAAGAAAVLGLSPTATTDALGLAGYLAPVPSHNKFLATPEGGGMAKYGPAGWTAQGGVTAAVLARLGYQGDHTVLDGEHGFATMVGSTQFDAGRVTDGLGERWNLRRVMYKRWPCAGNLQSPLGAFTALVDEHGLGADEIEAVHVSNEAFALQARFLFDGLRHNVDTQTNLAYNLALAAHRVPVSSAWQSAAHREDPRVRAFMEKVTLEAYDRAEETREQELAVEGREYIERRPCLVRVRARGRELTRAADHAYWLTLENEEYRASDDDLVAKFRANAGACLSPAATDRAVERVLDLEHVENVADLLAELVPG